TEKTLDVAIETGASPVLVPASHGDLASLLRAAELAEKRGITALLDPVLDPIHFGFMRSLARYAELRSRLPEAEILMGTGNLTELTDADSGGVTAALMGICSELAIRNVLVVQVSPHTRRTIQEHDAARRLMFAARRDGSLPKDVSDALLQVHARKPFPNSPQEISELAAEVKDANFRIEVAEDGIHVYHRGGHYLTQDALSVFPKLGVEADAPHAFYLGTELAKAEIAWRWAKRYAQDERPGRAARLGLRGRPRPGGSDQAARSRTHPARLEAGGRGLIPSSSTHSGCLPPFGGEPAPDLIRGRLAYGARAPGGGYGKLRVKQTLPSPSLPHKGGGSSMWLARSQVRCANACR